MKTTALSFLRLSALSFALAGLGHAVTPVSDNFSSATLNTSRWSVLESKNAQIKQSGGKVQFSVGPGTSLGDEYASLDLVDNYPGINENWQVTLDCTNTAGGGKNVSCGIWIDNNDSASAAVFYEILGAKKNGDRSIRATFLLSDQFPAGKDLAKTITSTSVSLRVSFNSLTKLLIFHYDSDGAKGGYQWTELGTYSVTGIGGDRGGDWDMDPVTGGFKIRIGGFGSKLAVTKGKLKLDNFSLGPILK